MEILDLITSLIKTPSVDEVLGWLPPVKRRIRRVLLLSDIHANWLALVAVLKAAQGSYDATWFLGDMLGYGPRPLECLQFLRRGLDRRGHWLPGNHEHGIIHWKNTEDKHINGSKKQSWEMHRRMIQEQSLKDWDWFAMKVDELDARPVKRHYGGFCQVFTHNHPDDPHGHGPNIYPNDSYNIRRLLDPVCKRMFPDESACQAAWIIHGHNHMPALHRLLPGEREARLQRIVYGEPIPINPGVFLINPGSVGQPRDGDPRAAYAILDTEKAEITYYRTRYDVQAVQAELRSAGYPEALVERLGTGRIGDTQYFEAVYRQIEGGKGIEPCKK